MKNNRSLLAEKENEELNNRVLQTNIKKKTGTLSPSSVVKPWVPACNHVKPSVPVPKTWEVSSPAQLSKPLKEKISTMLIHALAEKASKERKDKIKRLMVFIGGRKMEGVVLLGQMGKVGVSCFD